MNSLADIVVKATPGPWKGGPAAVILGADGKRVCQVAVRIDTADVADAQLIALAHTLATLVLEAREKGRALLAHRVGDLPTQGWLRDNDASRAALADLAATLAKLESL